MDLINEIDKLLAQDQYTNSRCFDDATSFEEGYEQALEDVRSKALAYVKHQQAQVLETGRRIALFEAQLEDAQDKLLAANRMIVPGHRSLGDLVDILVDERDGAVRDLDDHNCEDECDNCSWGVDECTECDDVAGTVKRAIEILEELT